MKEIDFEKNALEALKHAQFGFMFKPLSVNEYLIPANGRLVMSGDARNFKFDVQKLLILQKKRIEWELHNRYFSLTIILNRNKVKIDSDNAVKLIMDAFVSSDVIPDDRHCVDSRQMYADFSKSDRVSNEMAWAVLVRWGKEIPVK